MKWTTDRTTWKRGFAWIPMMVSNESETYIWLEPYEYRKPERWLIEVREIGSKKTAIWKTTGP